MSNVIEALLVTKGHAFEREPFFQFIDRVKVASPDTLVHWTHVEHPAAEAVLFEARNFRYGGIGFEDHPTGSNLVGWTKKSYNSPIAYLQFGQDHIGYENPIFTTLLNNAIRWGVAESNRSEYRFQRISNVESQH